MNLRALPQTCTMRWRRTDVPGRETASIVRRVHGWTVKGELSVREEGFAFELTYCVECRPDWHTRSALVEGTAAGAPVHLELTVDANGDWSSNGHPVPSFAGCIDVDLGFTPATNTLPIRRLGLQVGQTAPVRSAWLRFPELRLEPLSQSYTRSGPCTFHYSAMIDGEPFTARLDTDPYGRVLVYEGLWQAEMGEPV